MLKKKIKEEKNWEKTFVTQKLILWHPTERKFLLAKAIDGDTEVLGRFGGHLEVGEVLIDGFKREIAEEAGKIKYDIIDIIDIVRADDQLIVISYLAEYQGGDIQLSDETTGYEWLTFDAIQKNEKISFITKNSFKKAVQRLKEREYLIDLKRLQADFENYKKRQAEAQKELKSFLIEQLVLDIIPVLDNFRSANGHIPEASKNEPWVIGVQYIEKQLEDVLAANGMQLINVKEGDAFDPNIHEAISQVAESSDENENSGEKSDQIQTQTVARVLQNGYQLGEKVIRPAKVIVA